MTLIKNNVLKNNVLSKEVNLWGYITRWWASIKTFFKGIHEGTHDKPLWPDPPSPRTWANVPMPEVKPPRGGLNSFHDFYYSGIQNQSIMQNVLPTGENPSNSTINRKYTVTGFDIFGNISITTHEELGIVLIQGIEYRISRNLETGALESYLSS
jgi:hypothetical protein